MKIILLYIITFLQLVVFAQIEPGAFDFIHHSECKHARSLLQFENPTIQKYDWHYSKIYWKLNPSKRFIEGNVIFHITALEPLNEVVFQLSNALIIDSIKSGNTYLKHSRSGNFDVFIDTTLLQEEKFDFDVYYHGIPNNSGMGSFVQSNHSKGDIIWTLSEPYGAQDWWPCKQSLSDKIDSLDIFIEVPDTTKAASLGTLEDSIILDSTIIFHWKHRHPVSPYLVATAVSNYKVFNHKMEINGDSLQLLNYLYPSGIEAYKNRITGLQEMFEIFTDLFGQYPYFNEKYGHAQFGWGGGMEHQTMSFMGSFGHELTAHELAHQWFGNKLTCGSWQDIWINEGFATYLTGLTYEKMFDGIYWNVWKSNLVEYITSQEDGSVYVYDTTNVSRIFDGRLSYYKAAMVLHMLRTKIGDDIFFSCLNKFVNNSSFSQGFARTQDLKDFLEQETNIELDDFFNQWIYNQGHPIVNLSYEQSGSLLKLFVSQQSSHSSNDVFDFNLDILVNGLDTFQIDLTSAYQTIIIPYNKLIDSIRLNPFNNAIVNVESPVVLINVLEDEFTILPNPAKEEITIYFDLSMFGMDQYQIVNNNGEVVRSQSLNNFNNHELDGKVVPSFKVNIKDLSKGTYLLVSLKNGRITNSKKFIKI